METIEFYGRSTPPEWAIRQRHLIDQMNRAAPKFVERYTRPDGTLIWRDEWPGMDGSDDPYVDHWDFEFPFTVSGHEVLGLSVFLIGYFDSYSEESVGTFYTEGATLECEETEHGDGYSISMVIGLAPFDLGVSQHVVFHAIPEAEHNIYVIKLHIRRINGEDSSWRRVNQRFINVIRKQLLIWRTVDPEAKADYAAQGEQMLAATQAESAGVTDG